MAGRTIKPGAIEADRDRIRRARAAAAKRSHRTAPDSPCWPSRPPAGPRAAPAPRCRLTPDFLDWLEVRELAAAELPQIITDKDF